MASETLRQTLLAVVRYAALRHDVGKANLFFARKLLRASSASDPIRHEILSVLITLESEARPGSSSVFADWFSAAAKRIGALRAGSSLLASPITLRDVGHWLIATHHRLFAARLGEAPVLRAHLRLAAAEELAANATRSGDPMLDLRFVRAWAETAAVVSARSGDDLLDAQRIVADDHVAEGLHGREQGLVERTAEKGEADAFNTLIGAEFQCNEVFRARCGRAVGQGFDLR